MEQADTSMGTVIRGWIGEARVEDQRRIGELAAQVQRLQQMRGAASGPAATRTAGESYQSSAVRRRKGKSGTSSLERTSCAAATGTRNW